MQAQQLTQIVALPEGKEALPFNNTPLNDTGCMGLVLLVFFFLAISFRSGYKYVSNFSHHMFSVRKRQNAFEDHTMSETQMMIALLSNTCLMVGLLLYVGINRFYPEFALSEHIFKSVGCLTLLFCVFILLQLVFYYLLGFVFAQDREDIRLWIDGFNSSQCILGLFLFPIAFITILYPTSSTFMLNCSIILYFCSRLVFISKGFRIFFNNLESCIYFILYLCTVEIVPVFIMCAGAIYLCKTI